MKLARRFLIFSYGLFTIAAQTLLFREFLTSFEGNDISVGIFFASWFLWVALSAVVVYRLRAFTEALVRNIEFLFLAYLPALVLQAILIILVRRIASVEHFALLPLRSILLLSIIVNAPISIITGILFPTACRWIRRDEQLAISHVYILEAAGSFIGGLGTTLLLASAVSSARVSFILAFIVSLSAAFVQLSRIKLQLPKTGQSHKLKGLWLGRFAVQMLVFSLPVFLFLGLVNGIDKDINRRIRLIKWTLPLQKNASVGSFYTAQAEYLYGNYAGQWIVYREGSFIESLPEESQTAKIAVTALSQNPPAEKILVVGSGLGLCKQFLKLDQIQTVTWAHSDNEYISKINELMPSGLKVTDKRLEPVYGDIRSFLEGNKQAFDIVIVNLPDATSSVLNRYFTYQFYRQVKESLRTGGVFTIRIAGGENIMGTELVNLGASTKLTLEKVFSRLVLTPGENTWFIASDSENLTDNPGTLKDRLAKIDSVDKILTPDALFSIYLPERTQKAMDAYDKADLPNRLLINTDSRPLTHLYSLLLTAKQAGTPAAKFVNYLALAGPLTFLVPILFLIVLRVAYFFRPAVRVKAAKTMQQIIQKERKPSFDSTFLAFSAGLLGIGVVIVLMYLYQTQFGSLYLYIGIISSLFMLGITAGASLVRGLLAKFKKLKPVSLLFVVIPLHTLLLVTIACRPSVQQNYLTNGINAVLQPLHLIFGAAFLLCGICAGSYFPVAAKLLTDVGFETGRAAGKLETADHLGACAGGLLTSLLLLTVLGTTETIFVFILLLLANIPAAVLIKYNPKKIYRQAKTTPRLKTIGYFLFGIGASVIICSNLLVSAAMSLTPKLPRNAAQSLAGQLTIKAASKNIGDKTTDYFNVYEAADKIKGYIFSSEQTGPEVRGYGGKINLAIYTDTMGKLIDFQIISSNETPEYLKLVMANKELFKGRTLLTEDSFAGIDTVTQATISYKAITSALLLSTNRFFDKVIGGGLRTSAKQKINPFVPDKIGIYLIIAFVISLIVIYFGGFWSRFFVLCFNLVAGGLLLNAQYSIWQTTTILSANLPAVGLSGAFLLTAGIPLAVLIFGNVYCGYICPFGALQELLSYLKPQKLKTLIPAEKLRMAAFCKYIILFIFIIAFFLSRKHDTLGADLLIGIFSARGRKLLILIAIIAIAGSFFYTRFWCRYLCPAGAFLSLLNRVAILKSFLPEKKYPACEFSLTAVENYDCIQCDRCRYELKTTEQKAPSNITDSAKQPLARYFLPIVVAAVIFISAVTVNRLLQNIPKTYEQTAITIQGSSGQIRDVDLKRIRKMIEENKLSDKEAEYYKQIK